MIASLVFEWLCELVGTSVRINHYSVYCLLSEVDEGAVTVMHVEVFGLLCSSFLIIVRKNDSERWIGMAGCCFSLMLSAVISGKHDSDFGLGSCVLWCEFLVLFLVNRLTSLSLSSLGLRADKVKSSLTAFNSD